MKKLLVLSMSCNNPFYDGEDRMLRDIWARDIIDGKFPEVEFFSYTASYDGKYHVNYSERRLFVPCDDSLHGTMEKTIKTFRFLRELGIDYEYVFRTNTSTYINVKLLRKFVNELYDNGIIWTHSLFSAFIDSGPYEYCLYGLGSGLLMSKKYVDAMLRKDVIDETYRMVRQDKRIRPDFMDIFYVTCTIDDNAMGYTINTYLLNFEKTNQEKKWQAIPGVFWTADGNSINPESRSSIMTIYRLQSNDERHKEFEIAPRIHEYVSSGDNDSLNDLYERMRDNDILMYRPSGDPNVPSIYSIVTREDFRKILKEISEIPYLE